MRIDELLRGYQDSLDLKNIHTRQELLHIARIDMEKIISRLFDVQNSTVADVVSHFFDADQALVPEILARLDEKFLYHCGFEIYEPLDLIVSHGFRHWVKKFNQVLDARIHIGEALRFPASQAFQDRVQASVEIMRLWIHVDDHPLMLELFDIQRPVAPFLPDCKTMKHRSLPRLLPGSPSSYAPYYSASQLFKNDTIWHYAIYVERPEQVLHIHQAFQDYVHRNPGYELPFTSIVQNKYDGSFYTKIIHRRRGIELEFVTQQRVHNHQPAPPVYNAGDSLHRM